MDQTIKRWWNRYADYYQVCAQIRTDVVHYGPFAPNEGKLHLLGNVNGKEILELGCGGGQCSIALAKQGARCTAIDFSKRQLEFADRLARKSEVTVKFIKTDIEKLGFKMAKHFDIVFSAFALQFVSDLDPIFKDVYRVLKRGGRFVFSLDHPFYALVSEAGKIEKSYYQTGKHTDLTTQEVFGGARNFRNSKTKFIIYQRKLSDIFNSLTQAGFRVDKIIEPNTFSKNDPWIKMYSLKVIKLIGPTIIFRAMKLNR